jgi:hypothetical protein
MQTTITTANFDAEGPGITDQGKACACASTHAKARPGEMTAHSYASQRPRGTGPKDRGSKGPISLSDMTPRPVDEFVGER